MDFLGRAKTFVRVVEVGSLSKAARSLGVSLAAISRQMGALEAELGASLIARTTRSLRVTDEGRRFHGHALRLLRDADTARESVRRDRAIGGEIVLSTSVTLGLLRIVPQLPKLLSAHPGLELDVRLEDRAVDLVGEGVDIAVRAGMALPDTTRLIALPLAEFGRVLVAAPAYLRKHGTPRSVAALAGHAVVGSNATSTWTFVEDGETRAVTLMSRLRVGTSVAIREAVIAGLGIAVFPDFVVREALADRTLRPLLPGAVLSRVSAHALYRVEARGTARIDAVIGHLRATMPLGPT